MALLFKRDKQALHVLKYDILEVLMSRPVLLYSSAEIFAHVSEQMPRTAYYYIRS